MRKICAFFLLLALMAGQLQAQFQVGMGLNPFNHRLPEIHNMAFLPLHSVPSLSLLANGSMNGFDRHPYSASLLCSGFLVDKLGAGLKVNYDQAGLSSKTDLELGMVYYIFIQKKSGEAAGDRKGDKMAFSLSGHFIQDRLKRNEIRVMDPNDPGLTDIAETSPNGDASVGIAFLRENKYYAGLSVHQLIGTSSSFLSDVMKNARKRHYYLQGSYIFDLDKNGRFGLEAHAAAAAIEFTDYRWEAGLCFNFLKAFSVGAGYQSTGAIKMDVSLKAQSWDFGYACSYGAWIDATAYSYKGFQHGIFVRKLFNEGRRSK